jgi:uncharacterized protein
MMCGMNLESLHSMATDSLIEIARRLGLDLPEGLERPFIIEEILDAQDDDHSSQVSGSLSTLSGLDALPAEAPDGAEGASIAEAPGLNDTRYNESSIMAILKDPSWAYLTWDLKEDEYRPTAESESKAFSIRVLELASPLDPAKNALSWFDFSITSQDGEWYVNLPEDGMSYVFELGANSNRDRKVLARSNIVQTPKVRRERDFERLPRTTKTLLELSGYSDYISVPEDDSRGSRILPMGKE